MKAFIKDDVVYVPRKSNMWWFGLGVIVRSYPAPHWAGPFPSQIVPHHSLLMLSGRMKGQTGGFPESQIHHVNIIKCRFVKKG